MTYFVICSSVETATHIAQRIHAGDLPDCYPYEALAVEAWRAQPMPCWTRYHVWRVQIASCAVTAKRLDIDAHQLGEKP